VMWQGGKRNQLQLSFILMVLDGPDSIVLTLRLHKVNNPPKFKARCKVSSELDGLLWVRGGLNDPNFGKLLTRSIRHRLQPLYLAPGRNGAQSYAGTDNL